MTLTQQTQADLSKIEDILAQRIHELEATPHNTERQHLEALMSSLRTNAA